MRTLQDIQNDLADILTELEAHQAQARAEGYQARTYYIGRAVHEGHVTLLSVVQAVQQVHADDRALVPLGVRP